MTLQSKDNNIPNWKRIHKFLNRKINTNVNILFGDDGTGNLYNLTIDGNYAGKIFLLRGYLVNEF